MTPSHQAKLTIQGGSITNAYTHHLIRAYIEPNYIKFLQDQFHWSKQVTLQVSWTGLRWGLRRIQRDIVSAPRSPM